MKNQAVHDNNTPEKRIAVSRPLRTDGIGQALRAIYQSQLGPIPRELSDILYKLD